jgi:hypothetical protein
MTVFSLNSVQQVEKDLESQHFYDTNLPYIQRQLSTHSSKLWLMITENHLMFSPLFVW